VAGNLQAAAERELAARTFSSGHGVSIRMALLDGPTVTPVPPGVLRSFTILPGPSGDGGCTAVRVVLPAESGTVEDTVGMLRLRWGGALGPCWYLATFGAPGPAIRAWLDSRYWDVAAAIPPREEVPNPRDEASRPPELIMRMVGEVLGVFAQGSATLEGCLGDRPELCQAAFLSPLPEGLLPPGIAGNERLLPAAHVPSNWLFSLPPSATRSLLAMMVEDFGPDRFEILDHHREQRSRGAGRQGFRAGSVRRFLDEPSHRRGSLSGGGR